MAYFESGYSPVSRHRPTMPPTRPAPAELIQFLGAYDANIQRLALAARAAVIREAPDAAEFIYDASNAVSVGFSLSGKPSEHFVHVATYAGWVNLGFNFGTSLPDPLKRLQGDGNRIRHLRLTGAIDLRDPYLVGLVQEAIDRARRGDIPTAAEVTVVAVSGPKRRPAKALAKSAGTKKRVAATRAKPKAKKK